MPKSTIRPLPAIAVLAALLVAGPAAGATFIFDTPISGDSVEATVSVDDAAPDTVEFTVSIPAGEGDILGLFGNVVDESLLPSLAPIDPTGIVTQWQFSANKVWKVGGGNTMAPVKTWDWGVKLGATGSGGGVVESATFQLTAPGLDAAQIVEAATQGWMLGVRIQSTTGPQGSSKLGLAEGTPPVAGVPPEIAITSPPDGLLTNQTPLTVTGTVSGSTPLGVEVNGVAATVAGGTWTAVVPLAEGANVLVATATNDDGSDSDQVSIVLDSQPPAVVITAPTAGSVFVEPTIGVFGTIADASSIVEIRIDGDPIQPSNAFATTTTLALGPNTVTVDATDAAGNVGTDTVSVVLDDPGPLTVSIATPPDGSLVSAPGITVAGLVSDGRAQVRVNGVLASVTAGGYTAANVPLTEGDNVVTAMATLGSRTAQASVTVQLNTPPQIVITSPRDGATLAGASVDVRGVVSDTAALVDVNGVRAQVGSDGSFVAPGVSLDVGSNLLTARAIDTLGARGTHAVSVTRDDAEPPRLRVVLLDPARCPLDDDPCSPIALVAESFEEFRNALAVLDLPVEGFQPPVDQITQGDRDFHAYVFGEEPGDASLGLSGATALVSVGTTPTPMLPLSQLAADLAGQGLDPTLEDELVPSDFPPQFFARFDLDIAAASGGGGGAGGPLFPLPKSGGIDFTYTDGGEITTLADLDGDGDLDLLGSGITRDFSVRGLNVLLGNGTARFQETAAVFPALQGLGVVTADLDGDGNLDAVLAEVNDVAVFLGNGDATFQPLTRYAVNFFARSVRVADMNGDDIPDLVAVAVQNFTNLAGSLSVLLGNGDGTFQPEIVKSPVGRFPTQLDVGDFDGDGDVDVVVPSAQEGQASVFFGQGNGTLSNPRNVATGSSPADVAVGDLNGDGFDDFVVPSAGDDAVGVLLSLGNTFFQPVQLIPVGSRGAEIQLSDMNGDDVLDIVLLNNFASGGGNDWAVTVLIGNGDGTFQALGSPRVNFLTQHLALGDVNGDGSTDVVTVSRDLSNNLPGGVGTLLNDGGGTLDGHVRLPGGTSEALALRDFDHDGNLDVAAANRPTHDLSIFLADGAGGFGPELRVPAGGAFPDEFGVGDLDQDGNLDLVLRVGTSGSTAAVLLGGGDGSFLSVPFAPSCCGGTWVEVGDVDGDGIPDVVGSNAYAAGNGDGTFSTGLAIGAGGRAGRLTDVNGDGLLDIVSMELFTNEGSVLLGNGDGTFGASIPFATSGAPLGVVVGDLNGDSIPDAAVSQTSAAGSEVGVFLGAGDGTFQESAVLFAAPGGRAANLFTAAQSVALADVDADGDLDVLTTVQPRSELFVFLNDGDGASFAPPIRFYAPGSPVVVGDLTADGVLDVLTGNIGPTLSRGRGTARPAGPLTLQASAGDAADDLPLFLDLQPPFVTITSPFEGAVVAGNQVTVSGSVRDVALDEAGALPTSVFGEVAYRVADALDVTIATGRAPILDGSFAIRNLLLGAGAHCIEVRAVDAGDNDGSDEVCFEADAAAPGVTLVAPLDGQALVADTVGVDLLFSATTTLVAVDGVPDGRVFDAGLELDVLTLPLVLGANSFDLDFESGGFSFTLSFTVFRLDAQPEVRILSPVEGAFLNTTTASVAGVVPLGVPFVQVNGVDAVIAADGVSFSAQVPIEEGPNDLRAVEFAAGTTHVVGITRDTVPPLVFDVLPADGTVTQANTASYVGLLDEPGTVTGTGPLGSVSAGTTPTGTSVGGLGGQTVFAQRFELPALDLAAGSNAIDLSAVDRAGNETVLALTLTSQGPALQLVAPAAGSSIPALRTDLVLEASEDMVIDALYVSGLRLVAVEGTALPTGQTTLPNVPLVPGANEIRVVHHRTGGSPEVLAFDLSSTATDAATVTGVVTDSSTGTPIDDALVSLTVNGISVIAVTGADGSYSVQMEAGTVVVVAVSEGYAAGSGGGETQAGDTLVADLDLDPTGLPAITNEVHVIVPPDGTVTDFDALTVVGTLVNPASIVTVNGAPAEVIGSRFVARGVALAQGPNTIDVVAIAPGVPTAVDSVSVERADEPVLAVKVFSPPDGAVIPGGGLVVRGFVSARETRTALAPAGAVTPLEGVFEITDLDLPVGFQSLGIRSETRDGLQQAADEIVVEVEATDPAFLLTADPASGDVPLQTSLDVFATRPLAVSRIDIDTDGDGTLDVIGSDSATATLPDARPYVPRAFATLPDGVEMSATALVDSHLPQTEIGAFAQGNPVDLAPAPAGDLFVLDGAAASISRYTRDGVLVSSFGASGAGPEQMSNPQALDVGPDGRFYVADTGNGRIQVFAPDGSFERSIGQPGSAVGELSTPRGVLVKGDELYVSDTGNARVQVFSLDDDAATAFFPLQEPRGLADGSGDGVLVTSPVERLRGAVPPRVVTPQGLASFPPQAELGAAVDVAVGGDGAMVADAGRSQVVLTWTTLFFRRVVDGLARPPVAVLPGSRDAIESIYVADGLEVVEIGLPVPSPLPAFVGLRDALAAGDIDAAVEHIHPFRQDAYREIYEAIEPVLAQAVAGMQDVDVLRVRDGYAVLLVHRETLVDGDPTMVDFPVRLVRDEQGRWLVFDY